MIPVATTVAVVHSELEAAQAFAERRGWFLRFDRLDLSVTIDLVHPVDGQPLRLVGDLAGYREVPPAWRFKAIGEDPKRGAFPAPGPLPTGASSIFHPQPVLCAAWNRLAYAEAGGPHGDWGPPTGWQQVTGFSTALNLGEMLAAVGVHLQASPGRMQ